MIKKTEAIALCSLYKEISIEVFKSVVFVIVSPRDKWKTIADGVAPECEFAYGDMDGYTAFCEVATIASGNPKQVNQYRYINISLFFDQEAFTKEIVAHEVYHAVGMIMKEVGLGDKHTETGALLCEFITKKIYSNSESL